MRMDIVFFLFNFLANLIHITTTLDEYLFSCDNAEDRDGWINALEATHHCNCIVNNSEMVYTRYSQIETPESI